MKFPLSIAFAVCVSGQVFSQEAGDGYKSSFELGRSLEKSDPDGAVAAYFNCIKLATAAGDANFANAAGLSGCWVRYRQGRIAETGELAAEAISIMAPLPPDRLQISRRVQFFGFMERGFLTRGLLGEAMRSNRAAAETLRGKFVSADADGRPMSLEEAIALPSFLRGFGWRLLERDAQLLDYSGKSVEAMEILDGAAGYFGDNWTGKLTEGEHFYAFKLLASRAEMKDFLGYKEEALRLQAELAEAAAGAEGVHGIGIVNLRINRLRNLSLWEGPSEEILGQAKVAAAELKRLGDTSDAGRLIAKMEFDLEASRAAAEDMRASAARNLLLGNEMEAGYAQRDELDALARLGDAGLDGRYFELLAKARRQGRKISEPSLYASYGNYLFAQKRYGEAIGMYSEALRLTRSFGLFLHEPALMGKLFNARMESGDISGARAVLAELDAYVAKHPDATAERLSLAHGYRAAALARLGDVEASRTVFALARKIAEGVPEYQAGYLSEQSVEQFFASLAKATPAKSAPPVSATGTLDVEASEVFGIAAPGEVSRVTFSVSNPGPVSVAGHFEISGPSPAVSIPGRSVRFVAGGAVSKLSVPSSITSGGIKEISFEMAPAAAQDAASVSVAWKTGDLETGPASEWNLSWDESATGRVVMDASAMEASPFRCILFRHELSAPPGETAGIPFRLRSPVPLRIEYYETAGGAIIAVDENGNGDFTETGDFHLFSPGGNPSPVFPVSDVQGKVTAEIRVFAPDGKPLPVVGDAILLVAEVLREGEWVKEAEDVIR